MRIQFMQGMLMDINIEHLMSNRSQVSSSYDLIPPCSDDNHLCSHGKGHFEIKILENG